MNRRVWMVVIAVVVVLAGAAAWNGGHWAWRQLLALHGQH